MNVAPPQQPERRLGGVCWSSPVRGWTACRRRRVDSRGPGLTGSPADPPLLHGALRLDTFLLLVPVVVGAIVLYRALRSRPGEQGSSPVAVEPAADGPPDLPLAAKLSALDTGISAAAAGIAHPRELYEVTEFKAAIRLLRDEHVDADIVLSYALGGTWTVACAALAALAERPDRAVVMSEIYAAIDNMSVYPMFFALQNVIADPDAGPVSEKHGTSSPLARRGR